jgi:hypothetical protein
MFDIRVDRLLTSIEAASAGAEAFGRITVGDFSERFLMSLSYARRWSAMVTDDDLCLVRTVDPPRGCERCTTSDQRACAPH